MKIAVATTGGDAPGLNAVLEGCAAAARTRGLEIVGLRDGFGPLLAGTPDAECVRWCSVMFFVAVGPAARTDFTVSGSAQML